MKTFKQLLLCSFFGGAFLIMLHQNLHAEEDSYNEVLTFYGSGSVQVAQTLLPQGAVLTVSSDQSLNGGTPGSNEFGLVVAIDGKSSSSYAGIGRFIRSAETKQFTAGSTVVSKIGKYAVFTPKGNSSPVSESDLNTAPLSPSAGRY